ncbi:MAG: phage tail protein [Trinickia sp.]|uniref:phage tail protein n=1 Tax=Trinickia sp. TaxID=2571163 RepID=UPI003F7E2B5B
MADQFLGEIRIFGFDFAPKDWAYCDGQQVPVQQNSKLFAVLGDVYGGNGVDTFALPDLRGRAAMAPDAGGLNNPQGVSAVQLTADEIPAHTHTLYADTGRPSASDPTGRIPAKLSDANNCAFIAVGGTTPPVMTQLSPASVGTFGGSSAHENRQPYTSLNFCIALKGA